MSLNIEAKKATVEGIAAGIANAQTLVIAEYRGISVANLTELRANARKEGVYLHVLKNTLVRRAVEGTSFAALADQMVGPLIYAASEDAVAAAKVIHQFSKKDDKIVVKAGVYNGDLHGEVANAFFKAVRLLIDVVRAGRPCVVKLASREFEPLDRGHHVLAQGACQGARGYLNGGLNFFF